MNRLEPFTNAFSARSGFAKDTYNSRMRFWPDSPDMQVCNGCITRFLNQLADFLCNVLIGLIQQHSRGDSHQTPCPTRNNDGTHNAYYRIQPYPSEITASEQCGDCQDGGQSVRYYMDVS